MATPATVPAPAVRKRGVETSHLPRNSEPTDEAGQLFAAANAARGAGDLRVAARRYELLERRHPASPEAAVSLVSAGDVLLRLGETAAALEHFDRYLGSNGRGALALEALFGRARALRDLERRPDELETWRELLRRFPGSLYEATARRRLDELAR
jgi:outer membrane protein assembly factor BamD (BamD/ComL family)